MRTHKIFWRAFFTALTVFSANSYFLLRAELSFLWVVIPAFLLPNLLAGFACRDLKGRRMRCLAHGVWALTVFLFSILPSLLCHILYLVFLPWDLWQFVFSILVSVLVHAVLFWNGIISVYLTSFQLGIKTRIWGIVLGLVPVANLFALGKILRITDEELAFEREKEQTNEIRRDEALCQTRYPILLVHGLFFRDRKLFNYWGRVPEELQQNGATIYYGNHQSALSIRDSAKELAARVRKIVTESGCEKVNIIAHSKGGLDCRFALANEGIASYVASLTTINTPHRGCGFADYLLDEIPKKWQEKTASVYNTAARVTGDTAPDFMAAIRDLTASSCETLDKELTIPDGIFCQSVGSVMKNAAHGQFPLNFSYLLVKHFDGPNDGLVSESSFAFGEKYTCLSLSGKRGISHGDMIDLNRENIPDFDVREFYVQLVHDLKERGL